MIRDITYSLGCAFLVCTLAVNSAHAKNASQNVTFEFEKDREMVQEGNVIRVQSDGDYKQQQMTTMAERIAALEQKLKALEDEIKNIQEKPTSKTPASE